jgi:hypothetical protein
MFNNFKDNPIAAAYVAMYEKQTPVDELEEATDLSKVSTDKLQSMWDSHKDEERPSPALAAQLKRISAELAQRKKSNMKERADWVPEEISDEGVADFMGAAAAAAKKGDKTFKFGDKEYKVTMKKSTADAIDEEYSPQEIKQAIGIAADKRYAGGNMTGATSAIEKLKAGLSDHPQVKAVLKSKNEQSVDESLRQELAAMGAKATEIEKYANEKGGIDKADMLKVSKFLGQGNMKAAVDYAKTLDTDPRDWLLTKMGVTK